MDTRYRVCVYVWCVYACERVCVCVWVCQGAKSINATNKLWAGNAYIVQVNTLLYKGLPDQLDIMLHANGTQLSLGHSYAHAHGLGTWVVHACHKYWCTCASLLMLQPQQLTKPWMGSNQVAGCVPTINREGSLSINTKNSSMGSSVPQGSKHTSHHTTELASSHLLYLPDPSTDVLL